MKELSNFNRFFNNTIYFGVCTDNLPLLWYLRNPRVRAISVDCSRYVEYVLSVAVNTLRKNAMASFYFFVDNPKEEKNLNRVYVRDSKKALEFMRTNTNIEFPNTDNKIVVFMNHPKIDVSWYPVIDSFRISGHGIIFPKLETDVKGMGIMTENTKNSLKYKEFIVVWDETSEGLTLSSTRDNIVRSKS